MGGEDEITQCNYEEREVGKLISSTKIKHIWSFCIKNTKHFVELLESRITGRKKVYADQRIVFPKQVVSKMLTCQFEIDGTQIALIQIGNTYDLRINNFPFNHLMEVQKNKKAFSSKDMICISRQNIIPKKDMPCVTLSEMGNSTPENKENIRKPFNFAIKPANGRKNSKGDPVELDKNKLHVFYDKSGIHSKENFNRENLLNFCQGAKDQSGKNLIDLSPLVSPTNFDQKLKTMPKQEEAKPEPKKTDNLVDLFDILTVSAPKTENIGGQAITNLNELAERYARVYEADKKKQEEQQVKENPQLNSLLDISAIPARIEPVQKESNVTVKILNELNKNDKIEQVAPTMFYPNLEELDFSKFKYNAKVVDEYFN